MPTTPNTDAIATLAYEYWEAEGRPHGKDIEHWLKAEQSLTVPAMPAMKEPHVLHAAAANARRRPARASA